MTVKSLFRAVCEFWKPRIVSAILLVCLLATGVFYLCNTRIKETFVPGYRYGSPLVHPGEIVNGVLLRQSLRIEKPVKSIAIKFATFTRKNHGKIRFYLKDDTTGAILHDTLLDMSAIADNQYHRISFRRPIKTVRGHEIAFYLEGTPECRSGNAVTCWAQASDYPAYRKNGAPGKGTLVFKASMRYKRAHLFPPWWYVLGALTVLFLLLPQDSEFWDTKAGVFCKRRVFGLALLGILAIMIGAAPDFRRSIDYWLVMTAFAAVFLLILKDDFLLAAVRSPEKIFLVVGGLSVMAIFYFTPPLDGEDAAYHMVRIYQISEGKFLFHPRPADVVSKNETDWLSRQTRHANEVFYKKLSFSTRNASLKTRPFGAETMNRKHYLIGYTPLAYLPQAGAAYFARKAGLRLADGVTLIYALSALMYLTAMYFMIRAIPVFKWPLLLFALTPAVIYHGLSFSADPFLILGSVFFFMLVMKYREMSAPYTKAQLFWLAAVSFALCQCKFVYFPMLGMMFLLPPENFGSRKRYFGFIFVTICGAVFLGWLWNKLATDYSALLNTDGKTTAEKMAFVVRHPWKFFMMWIKTQFPAKLPITLRCAFDCLGTRDYLSRHDLTLFPGLFPEFAAAYCTLYLSVFCFIRERALKLWMRFGLLFLFLWSVGLIYIAIYCVNTIVFGIQGRFLIPLFPLLFPMLGQNRFDLPEKYLPYYKGFLVIILVAVQIMTADALRQAYWL